MVRRPDSLPDARRAMRIALQVLAERKQTTPCKDRPIPYTDLRQTPEAAKKLCEGCPVLMICRPLGYTESVYADDMVYGGLAWRRGKPVSETSSSTRKASLDKLVNYA